MMNYATGEVSLFRSGNALVLLLLLLLYILCLSIYRLYLHPLAKFPGDKLAGLTTIYAFYHDMVRPGQYWRVVEEMHIKYGPVVRVRPDALHVNDPEFIDVLYTQSPKVRRERYKTITDPMNAPGSMLASKDHDLHRKRRSVLNPYFSKQNVRRLEPIINSTLETLLLRMAGWARDGKPIHANTAFRAATKDVIQAYAFGPGEICLEMEDCNAKFFDVITPQRVCHIGTYFPRLCQWSASMPPSLTVKMIPRVAVFAQFVMGLGETIERIKNDKDYPEHRTIFHEILRSDIPESEKETKRVVDEAMVIVVAGSETTASTQAAIMYHMLSDPTFLQRLQQELKEAMPDPARLPEASMLDSLPFLNAVIQEAIRMYPGATHRQDRVAPDDDLICSGLDGKQFIIPAGTCIGMTAPLVNRHPSIYERPDEFLPDRYIDNPKLLKYQMSFSKGTRQCLGINLAYQELQSFTAGIFRRYSVYDPTKKEQDGPTLELFETTIDDISMYSDYITPGHYEGSSGLRIMIRA